jgi:Tfp pilus assembly protein PilF
MGLSYLEMGDQKKATDNLKEALKINPRFGAGWK